MIVHARAWTHLANGLHILRFQPTLTADYLVINLLPLVKRAVAGAFDGGVMNKNMLSALGLNKAKALIRIEPMYFA